MITSKIQRRRHLLLSSLVAFCPTVALGQGMAPSSATRGEDRVVYHWKKTVSADGRVLERTLNSELMDWLDAGHGSMDLERLVDSQVRSYRLEADAWQEADGADVNYEMRLVQYEKTIRSEEEIERSWWEAHPQGTMAEFEAFLAKRRGRPDMPTAPPVATERVLDWLAQAQGSDMIDVVVLLQENESPLDLPRLASNLFRSEPAFALRQMERRLLLIEERKNELEVLQRPTIDRMLASGGTLLDTYWILNGFEARVSAEGLAALASDPSVRRIERLERGRPDDNNLDDMREAAQVVQLHDAGYDGESPSGRSSINDIYLAIIDTNIDADHPAWDDWSGSSSRLVDIWRKTLGVWHTVSTSATTTPSHGTKVAGIAVGDLMQDQDPAITSSSDQDDRTGFGTEASFSFIEENGSTSSIEKAIELYVDIINLSMSFGTPCDLGYSSNDAVDNALLDGIFFAKSGGNNNHSSGSCVVGNPGTASGSFTVNQLDRSAVPLQSAFVNSGASRGGDSIGRSVVSIAAYAGPEGETAAKVGDTYGAFGASSAASPVVAGTAAALKDHLLDIFSSSFVNQAGTMHAMMLLMADGQLESGSTATALDPLDDVYGAGRLRMRMFNAAGMDAPWRARLSTRVIDDGEFASDMPVNPDAYGVNQPLSNDVERLKATAYWHEPNIEDGSSWTAEIKFTIQNDLGNTYGGWNQADHRQRIIMGNVIGGREWTLQLNGLDVPKSCDSNYYYLQEKRKVYVAVYWEDTDRDDADGPDASIE